MSLSDPALTRRGFLLPRSVISVKRVPMKRLILIPLLLSSCATNDAGQTWCDWKWQRIKQEYYVP